MTLDNLCYEFGDFALNPRDRQLTYLNRSVALAGKDFDILVYLVRHAGKLVRESDLRQSIWSDKKEMYSRNLSTHISKIRRALQCDPLLPTFIKTHHGKQAYTFIANVRETTGPESSAEIVTENPASLSVQANLFCPVFFGDHVFKTARGKIREATRALYKEYKIDNARLCIFPSGVGVWHLTEHQEFSSIEDVARHRSEVYREILSGDHRINIYNDQFALTEKKSLLTDVAGKPGYILSLMVLDEPPRAHWTRLTPILKALSYLTPLEGQENEPDISKRREIFEGIQASQDVIEFGSAGVDIGYASWDGVAYLKRADGTSTIENEIIEFEIVLQATWWLSKCIYDRCVTDIATADKDELGTLVADLKRQHARLHGILATESLGQRTMIEALLKSSRIDRLVEDTLSIYEQI